MPPKLPNLKFKPRHVVRQKEEGDESKSASAGDELSLVQLERLRLQQEAAQQQPPPPPQRRPANDAPPEAFLRGDRAAPGAPNDRVAAPRGARTHSAQIAASRAAMYLAPEAQRFSANTMPRILEVRADNPGMTVYHPTPLDCTLPARLKAQEVEGPVEGDDQRPETTTQTDGIAFLKECDEELRRSREANMRFEREVLSASATKIELESAIDPQSEGELVWFQLPRFQTNPPFSLTQLPSGKIGEVKVYKSGRMVMEICGVYYDVAVEGYSAAGDGACNVVAAVVPPQQPDEKASCYQLGLLAKKMLCTPTIALESGGK